MKKRFISLIVVSVLLISCIAVLASAELTVEEVLAKIAEQNEKNQNYEADILTEMETPFFEGVQKNKVHVYVKSKEISRTDTMLPFHQVALKVGSAGYFIDHINGVKKIEPEQAVKENSQIFSNPEELKEHLNFKLIQNNGQLVLAATPKQNQSSEAILGKNVDKVEFYLTKDKMLVEHVDIYRKSVKFLTVDIEYENIDGIYFPVKTSSIITLAKDMGTMKIIATMINVDIKKEFSEEIFDPQTIFKQLTKELEPQ